MGIVWTVCALCYAPLCLVRLISLYQHFYDRHSRIHPVSDRLSPLQILCQSLDPHTRLRMFLLTLVIVAHIGKGKCRSPTSLLALTEPGSSQPLTPFGPRPFLLPRQVSAHGYATQLPVGQEQLIERNVARFVSIPLTDFIHRPRIGEKRARTPASPGSSRSDSAQRPQRKRNRRGRKSSSSEGALVCLTRSSQLRLDRAPKMDTRSARNQTSSVPFKLLAPRVQTDTSACPDA